MINISVKVPPDVKEIIATLSTDFDLKESWVTRKLIQRGLRTLRKREDILKPVLANTPVPTFAETDTGDE